MAARVRNACRIEQSSERMIANITFANYRSCRPSSTGSMRTQLLVATAGSWRAFHWGLGGVRRVGPDGRKTSIQNQTFDSARRRIATFAIGTTTKQGIALFLRPPSTASSRTEPAGSNARTDNRSNGGLYVALDKTIDACGARGCGCWPGISTGENKFANRFSAGDTRKR